MRKLLLFILYAGLSSVLASSQAPSAADAPTAPLYPSMAACLGDTRQALALNQRQDEAVQLMQLALGSHPTPDWLELKFRQLSGQLAWDHPEVYQHWTLVALDSRVPAAHSTASGVLLVTQALLRPGAYTQDEALAALAHEAAHVVLGHSLSKQCMVFMNLDPHAASRRFELEADRLAVQLLNKAGVPAQSLVTLLEKIAISPSAKKDEGPTHPALAARLRALKALVTQSPPLPGT